MFENEVFYLEKPSVDVGISSRVENILSIALIIGKVLPVIVIIIYIFMYYRKKKKCTTEQESQALKIQTRKELVPLLIGCLLVWFAPTFATWMFGKPIIYIYPEKEINLSVTLGYPNDITCSYPNYSQYNGWNVKAFPNGDLIDINSGKKLYSLYWEGRGNKVNTSMKQGFCVKGEDTAKFLEEKLDLLGLNYKEKEEFIVYWLPQLEKNKYNFIRFALTEECNEYMPLIIQAIDENGNLVDAEIDNLIRILMLYKPLNHKIEVEEQVISTPSRDGFTVVEWGGSKL